MTPTPSPWTHFAPAELVTCEPTLSGWIAHPAETASALAYILLAGWLRYRFGASDRSLSVRVLPLLLLIIGITSMLFHASYADVFQRIDVAAVPLFIGYILAATLVHRGRAEASRFPQLWVGLAGIGVLLPLVDLYVGMFVAVLQGFAVVWLWSGRRLRRRAPDGIVASWLLVPGAAMLGLDHAGVGCVRGPAAHLIQPHVVWHLLSAASAYLFYRAERRLERGWRLAAPR